MRKKAEKQRADVRNTHKAERQICDRIWENVPNFGFNNYTLAAVLYAYIILLYRVFFVVMTCDLCLAVLQSM